MSVFHTKAVRRSGLSHWEKNQDWCTAWFNKLRAGSCECTTKWEWESGRTHLGGVTAPKTKQKICNRISGLCHMLAGRLPMEHCKRPIFICKTPICYCEGWWIMFWGPMFEEAILPPVLFHFSPDVLLLMKGNSSVQTICHLFLASVIVQKLLVLFTFFSEP